MSLNLGNEGIAAIQQLRTNPDFQVLRAAILDRHIASMQAVLDSTGAPRDDLVGYARAFRDLYVAFECAAEGVRPQQIKRVGAVG